MCIRGWYDQKGDYSDLLTYLRAHLFESEVTELIIVSLKHDLNEIIYRIISDITGIQCYNSNCLLYGLYLEF